MRAWRPALLALAVTTACLSLAAPALAAFPGQNGKIVFNDYFSIKVVNPDGSGHTALAGAGLAELYGAQWSPDGQKIAYGWLDPDFGNDELRVMNADGSGKTTILTTNASAASWSPDGRRMIQGRSGDLYTMRYPLDGTGLTRLTTDGLSGQAEWSPDGSKIAFVSRRDGNFEIYTMNAVDGSAVTRLSNDPNEDQGAEWSPDGSKITFMRKVGGQFQVHTMNASDGSGVVQLTGAPAWGLSPAWSPDGRKIAFIRFVSAAECICVYVMNADGANPHSLNAEAPEGTLDWQPILHDAPQAADTLHMSLVPMFRQTISTSQCAARGGQTSTHGEPLAFSSCNPPGYLPNTMARLGPSSSSSVDVTGVPGDPVTSADEADLTFNVAANDVRARPGGGDYDPSASPDATLNLVLRWSDTYNGPALRGPATGSDLTYSVPVSCVATADPSLGSNCSTNTTADALAPGTILEGRRTVITLSRWWLYDSGLNATRGNADDRMFAQSGIYVP